MEKIRIILGGMQILAGIITTILGILAFCGKVRLEVAMIGLAFCLVFICVNLCLTIIFIKHK